MSREAERGQRQRQRNREEQGGRETRRQRQTQTGAEEPGQVGGKEIQGEKNSESITDRLKMCGYIQRG